MLTFAYSIHILNKKASSFSTFDPWRCPLTVAGIPYKKSVILDKRMQIVQLLFFADW